MSEVYWGLAGSVGTQGLEGVWGHQGIGVPRGRGILGWSGCIWD